MTGDVVAEPEPGDVRAPDAIEPLIGYRSWFSDPDSRLHSLNDRATWTPGEWMTAQCPSRNHRAPHAGCECGFYAIKERGNALALVFLSLLAAATRKPRTATHAVRSNDHPEPAAIVGSVQLAGKVIEHDWGYRAERARIVEVFPISGWSQEARSVAERYGVPIGEEIPAPQIPDFDLTGGRCGRSAMDASLDEPTVLGRLSIVAFSVLLVIVSLQGIAENHRLDWSDWFPCLLVLGSMLAIWWAIATIPRAMRGVSFTMQGPPASSLDGRPTVVPDRPRPY